MVIDKPGGMTSHDVVNRLRKITGERSIGHLGTLDPMATGVLPLLLGKFTRLAQFLSSAEKSYTGTIRFGYATDTYDAEGEKVGECVEPALTLEQVRVAAARFHGEIQQMPPGILGEKDRRRSGVQDGARRQGGGTEACCDQHFVVRDSEPGWRGGAVRDERERGRICAARSRTSWARTWAAARI